MDDQVPSKNGKSAEEDFFNKFSDSSLSTATKLSQINGSANNNTSGGLKTVTSSPAILSMKTENGWCFCFCPFC